MNIRRWRAWAWALRVAGRRGRLGLQWLAPRPHHGGVIPEFYFYLVDEGTQQPVAIFSADDCRMHYEVRAREGQIRARYRVDDVESGVLLRSGYSAPLPPEQVRAVLADMKRKGVSPIWRNG